MPKKYINNYVDGRDCEDGYEGVVVSVANHGIFSDIICAFITSDSKLYLIEENGLELVSTKKSIHITTDGTTTVAVLKDGKNIVKRAEAKLSPNDTFDFETGARIAFGRLFGIEPLKPYDSDSECKNVVDVKPPFMFKVIKLGQPYYPFVEGKTYHVYSDGIVEHENGTGAEPINCFSDLGKMFYSGCEFELVSSTPQVKEVKRKAKVGEWVKIVNPLSGSEQYYQKDDICKCIESKGDSDYGCYVTSSGTHPCNRGKNTSYLYNIEYVVLENYTPQQEQPKTYTQAELDEVVKEEREKIYAEIKKIFEK